MWNKRFDIDIADVFCYGAIGFGVLLMVGMVSFLLYASFQPNTHETIELHNKSKWTFDNVEIPIKEGYSYDTYDKFVVDENTVGVTIYFKNSKEEW